ncbi:MAG: response regulator [Candidatus Gracilibacteria bacterium]|nr:response regulator [Candidatus Gracilibacteria bacterium]
MDDLKILIVEDDEDLSTMYKLKFEKEGFDTRVSNNGLDAITLVTDFEPNVILLDIMMPGMDGFETLRVIRELAPSLKCKIVMFSNLNSKEDIDKCMHLGADAYLLKANTTPKEALEKIRELFVERRVANEGIDNRDTFSAKAHSCPHCGKNIHIDVTVTP